MISTAISEQDGLIIRKHFRLELMVFCIIQLILGMVVYFLYALLANEIGIFSLVVKVLCFIGVALWIYFWILAITKLCLLHRRIKDKTILKIEEDFIVLSKDQESLNSSQEFSESVTYVLSLEAENQKNTRSVEVPYDLYKISKESEVITLIYFDLVDILIGVRIGELASSDAKLKRPSELNLLSIIKKYK